MNQPRENDAVMAPSRRDALRSAVALNAVAFGATLVSEPVQAAVDEFRLPAATDDVTSFRLSIPAQALSDLKRRLAATRWPSRETVADSSQGVPLAQMQALVTYWRDDYDWRPIERQLNEWGQYRTRIDGLGIYFLHIRSKHKDAMPLLLTHGWPGSVLEFRNVIGPLTDPTRYGARAEDAFHLVIPALPGFGFSDKPDAAGWNVARTAEAWVVLMQRLGYAKWVAQGGDWGSSVATALGHLRPPGLAGIHLSWPFVFPEKIPATLSADEQRAVDAVAKFRSNEAGYIQLQSTRPQTVAYGLTDSPAGQAAWIYEKLQAWSDSNGDAASVLGRDAILDNITLYWLTDTAASSARTYWENRGSTFSRGRLELPVAASIFPHEIYRAPKSWAQQCYPNLIHWNELPRGGHFAAWEQPVLFAQELRDGFRSLR
jgi:pimeloyl-ACP methyl ester carboxylesterase